MEANFFERNGEVFVNIKTDASTSVDLVATKAHKARFAVELAAFEASRNPVAEMVEKPTPKLKAKKADPKKKVHPILVGPPKNKAK